MNAIPMLARCMIRQDPTIEFPFTYERHATDSSVPTQGTYLPTEDHGIEGHRPIVVEAVEVSE